MKIFQKLILSASIIVSVVASQSSYAELIETDWLTAGDNLLTVDTITGNKWLDLGYTNGWSVDKAGSELPGFTVASSVEVLQFFRNVGFTLSASCDPHCLVESNEIDLVAELYYKLNPISAWGDPGPNSFLGQGFTIDPNGENGIGLAGFSVLATEGQISVYSLGIDSARTSPIHAIWAYMAPVPEAETYALMLAGLGLIGWRTRRRG